MVDYVLSADHEQTAKLIRALAPPAVVRLEAGGKLRTAELIEHAGRPQIQ